jgi:DNA ligase-1
MLAFSQLLDRLSYTGSTLDKRRLMAEYFKATPDPERGWALSALAGTLNFPAAKPSLVRDLVQTRVDPVLFGLSRDYVGDMAETVALLWPGEAPDEHPPLLSEVFDMLALENKYTLRARIEHWLDTLDATGRWALLKLITGNIRIGVSARLAKLSLADAFAAEPDAIEQIWNSLQPPYVELFAWLEGRTEKPEQSHAAYFRPMMLAHALELEEIETLPLDQFQVELKWDGIRVQIVKGAFRAALYTRTGDEISETFPDLAQAVLAINEGEFVLDGELLAKQTGEVASFNVLQQRLNRKNVTAVLLNDAPAHVRLYDILMDNGEDVRALPLSDRRKRLEAWHARHKSPRMDVSQIIEADLALLHSIRKETRHAPQDGVEGLMLKRKDSPYIGGRPRGYWFKWKRDTLVLDCVLMYAQRGSGKRSSFYSDYTFGVWDEGKLVPVGKAYSGFTDEELLKLDRWIRAHTTERYGPVRNVEPQLVLEIEFDSIHASSRHKSGVAMRFPRVQRIRWDKPATEADTLETTLKLVP